MSIKDSTAIVGIGATPYYRRGESLPQSKIELACKAILAACEDAGLSVDEIDGFAYYSGGFDSALIAQTLGIPEITFTATLTGGGGGAAGSVGLAAAGIASGQAEVVVSLMALQQVPDSRFGAAFAAKGGGAYSRPADPQTDFVAPHGLFAPGQMFALLAMRHMHLYGTRREAFAEVAISTRANAVNRPTARFREPLTLDEYFNARMISDPLCLYDYTQENDGAVAVITTSAERARDLRKPPVYVTASAHGAHGRWGQAISWMGMPDEYFVSSGHRPVARAVYERAGVKPADIDVALLYDHFTPMVLMQLEDYGFCEIGEGGPFVEAGNIRFKTGSIPVNTHGGNLSEAYIIGMTHVKEAVEQLRGEAVNQVEDAEFALVTGGPASMPTSALILRR
ncbi:acetyl-CoA acetyltransferase [Actinocorallia sp. B10E7]|uniref:thiolase C-terminal domain-containing protein n=1 Tax=Actinocorallia sp. B10E7 TaxID=3153558 RepID=UPI00325DD4AE